MKKVKQPLFRNAATIACLILAFSHNANAQSIIIDSGDFNGRDTRVTVNLGSASAYTSTEQYLNPPVTTKTPITGSFTLYLNSFYSGSNASVDIDLSQANIAGGTIADYTNGSGNLYTITLNSPQTTNALSVHTMDYYNNDLCLNNPADVYCQNFDYGNASINPFPAFGTVEAGYDLVLDLGSLTLADLGNGDSALIIDSRHREISLSFIADDGLYSREEFAFTSAVVPLPASAWLFISGILALTAHARRRS